MATGDDLIAVINEARAAHDVAENRRQHPVDCPEHRWPLRDVGNGEFECQFGGHVITAPTRDK